MQTSEDRSVYDKVLNAIFDEEMLSLKDQQHHDGRLRLAGGDTSAIQYSDLDTEARDYVVEITREVFRQHCAKHLEVIPMRLLDDCQHFMRFFSKFKSLEPCYAKFCMRKYVFLIVG